MLKNIAEILREDLRCAIGRKGKHLTPADVDPIQLRKGIKVELEHTKDRRIALRIVLDHLAENPEYYTYLERMERSFKRKPS